MSERYSASIANARAGEVETNDTMMDRYLESEATVVERVTLTEPRLSEKQAKEKAIQDKKVYLDEWSTLWKKASQ